MAKSGRKSKLSLKEEEFCQLFASDKEFFGNGTQSYIEAFDVDLNKGNAYRNARSAASHLLTKSNILTRINELLEDLVLNDAHVDKQIALLITQNADFGSKLGAIKEYNALKARIKNKMELTGKDGQPLIVFMDSEGRKIIGNETNG